MDFDNFKFGTFENLAEKCSQRACAYNQMYITCASHVHHMYITCTSVRTRITYMYSVERTEKLTACTCRSPIPVVHVISCFMFHVSSSLFSFDGLVRSVFCKELRGSGLVSQ